MNDPAIEQPMDISLIHGPQKYRDDWRQSGYLYRLHMKPTLYRYPSSHIHDLTTNLTGIAVC